MSLAFILLSTPMNHPLDNICVIIISRIDLCPPYFIFFFFLKGIYVYIFSN